MTRSINKSAITGRQRTLDFMDDLVPVMALAAGLVRGGIQPGAWSAQKKLAGLGGTRLFSYEAWTLRPAPSILVSVMSANEQSDERFVALLVANQSRVSRFLLTLVPCRSDAEDLLQQTCLTLWQSRAKFDPAMGEFASWACAIAHNHVRNFRRREKTRRTVLSEEVAQSLITTRAEYPSLMDEWQQSLAHCMARLTPHQRSVVHECYGGSSIKSAAPESGRTPNALYKILRHIRTLLHACIQKTVAEGGAV